MRWMAAAGMVVILTGCMYGRLAPPPGVIRVVPEEGIPAWEPVAEGVSYAHIEKRGIRPGVHLLRIALESPGVRLAVPPPFPGGLEAEEAMSRANALAVNGSKPGASECGSKLRAPECGGVPGAPEYDRSQGALQFIAVWNGTPFRYLEGSDGRLVEPVGTWIPGGGVNLQQSAYPQDGVCHRGDVHSQGGTNGREDWGVLVKRQGRGVEVVRESDPSLTASIEWAVGGYLPILDEGENVGIHGERHARTAVGVSGDGWIVYLCVVEGERLTEPGLTSMETAEILRRAGAVDALNLDGGDSCTFLLKRPDRTVSFNGGRKELPCFMLLAAGPTPAGPNPAGPNPARTIPDRDPAVDPERQPAADSNGDPAVN